MIILNLFMIFMCIIFLGVKCNILVAWIFESTFIMIRVLK